MGLMRLPTAYNLERLGENKWDDHSIHDILVLLLAMVLI